VPSIVLFYHIILVPSYILYEAYFAISEYIVMHALVHQLFIQEIGLVSTLLWTLCRLHSGSWFRTGQLLLLLLGILSVVLI